IGLLGDTQYRYHYVHTDAAGNDSAVVSSAPFTTPASSGSQSVTLSTMVRTRLEMAPEAAMFQAAVAGFTGITDSSGNKNAYDQSTHDVDYIWTVRKQGQEYVPRPGDRHVNLPAVWNDTNTGFGKEFGHVFDEPGTYVITCTATSLLNKNEIATASMTFTVQDPDVVCAGTRTVIFDPSGTGIAEYPSADVRTTWTSALSALAAINGAGRMLIKAGVDVTIGQVNVTSSYDHFHIHKGGSGADPILRVTGSNRMFNIQSSFDGDASFQGLELRAPWDSTTEAGSHSGNGISVVGSTPNHIVVNDCLMTGFAQTIFGQKGTSSAQILAVHNSDLTNWGDYGVFQPENSNCYMMITATVIAQDVNAEMGGETSKNQIANQHGPGRIAGAGYVYMDCHEAFSRNGWSSSNGHGYPDEQSCWRLNTGHDLGFHCGIFRSLMEGGQGSVINSAPSGGSGQQSVANVVVAFSIFIGTARSSAVFSTSYGGWSIYSCMIIKPQTPRVASGGGDYNQMVSFSGPSGNRVDFFNNTLAAWLRPQDTDNDLSQYSGASGSGVSVRNSYQVAPNWAAEEDFDAQVDESTDIVTVGGTYAARHLGFKYNNYGNGSFQASMDTTFAVPNSSMKTLQPGPTSPLLNASTGITPIRDVFLNLRGASADQGAVERV
ncbi:MAG: hypothetical protein AAF808_03215, partial [Cyanobacteria bacterium P01_D01_bin.2]